MRLSAEMAALAIVGLASAWMVGAGFVGKRSKPLLQTSNYGEAPALSAAGRSSGSDEEAAIRTALAKSSCALGFTLDSYRETDRDPDPQVPGGVILEAEVRITRTENFEPALRNIDCQWAYFHDMAGLEALKTAQSATVMLGAKMQKREAGWRVNRVGLFTQ